MNKTKLAIWGGSIAAIVALSILAVGAVQAQTSALTVACSGSISGNQVTWTATSTSGNPPVVFLWSGDPSVAGQTSASFVKTYATNGTYNASIKATDASSSVATSTCEATITANVPPATTSTLNVIVSVNNGQGGTATPSNFTVTVSGASANPGSFTGSSGGTAVVVAGGTGYSVGASSIANYSESTSGNCAGPITAGGAAACTITEAYVRPTATSTPPLPRVNSPTLSIGANGAFLSHGMTVTSIASGSFQAEVWGITYTINWSGSFYPQLYFRNGNGGNATSSPAMQVAVGDEVGVSGSVSATNPLVVNANVVRDYSITMPRPGHREGHPSSPFYNGMGNGGGNGNGNDENSGNTNVNTSAESSSSLQGFSQQIQNLLQQLNGLQNLFKGKGNGK